MAGSRHPAAARSVFKLVPAETASSRESRRDCVVALRALSEDTRVRIVALLLDAACDVGEIADRLSLSQYNASKHLKVLREAGLLEVQQQGRRRVYSLAPHVKRETVRARVLDLGCCTFTFDAHASS
ncbi:MAG: ArsR/SmtB family transcription factor [Vicinamibacterales bacterium]